MSARVLRRSIGKHLSISGTDRVLAFAPMVPVHADLEAEIWELCTLRLMRLAAEAGRSLSDPPPATLALLSGRLLDAACPLAAVRELF